jgi:hypothetical protein
MWALALGVQRRMYTDRKSVDMNDAGTCRCQSTCTPVILAVELCSLLKTGFKRA